MFEAAAEALSERSEEAEDNPYCQKLPRVFGPQPGQYGMNMTEHMDNYTTESRVLAGEAWLNASSYTIDKMGVSHHDRSAIEERVKSADAFVHLQDLPETDILIASDYAAHEAGFAAAVARLGSTVPAMYNLDSTKYEAPQARTLSEEIARVCAGSCE